MDKEKQIEKFRVLWEQIMIGNKLEVCTEELKGAGILDVNILRLLFNNPKIIPKEIAGKLNIPNSTLTNAINRLEKRELIERRLNTNDLRSLQLLLTDKGKQAIQNHHNAERALIENVFGILSVNESTSLINIFEKISKNL
ncbi:MAG: MarR family winged helix-turn-helix transcriptional regulator [Lachnospiraceae bacterium]